MEFSILLIISKDFEGRWYIKLRRINEGKRFLFHIKIERRNEEIEEILKNFFTTENKIKILY